MPRPDPRDAAPPHLSLTSAWSIRSKLVAVLAMPVAAMVVLWIVATWVTLGPGLALLDARGSVDAVGRPTQELIAALQAERKLAVGYLASEDGDGGPLAQQYEQTDAAVAELRANADAGNARSTLTPAGAGRLDELLLEVSTLPRLRDSIEGGGLSPTEALDRYTGIVDAGLTLDRSLIQPSTEDLLREAQALVALTDARELLAREDAILTGAVVAGAFTSADLSQAVQLIGARRHQVALAVADLHSTDRDAYTELAEGQPATALAALEDRLLLEGRVGEPVPIDASAWQGVYDQVTDDLRTFDLEAADRLVERSRPEAVLIFGRIAVTGAIGLIALVVTAFGSVRVARSVLRRLAGLRQAALELAIDRIPRVVAQLRAGERVDVAAEAPPLPYGADEIGEVGRAFNALQRQAVGAAVAEADLRRGVNEVFLNIARRSQTLLHRQLSILDAMERRTEDPVELEDLFRVDHLATRMRRNAEDLVILAGAAPGRGWRHPVPLVDVLRGGISEVEDYARVSVRPVPEVAVTGRAVGDLIHLLAELIENATAFSPPSTKVTIGAEPVTHGLAIEIEDRGIGILTPALERINARLADPPDFGELASRSGGSSGELASRTAEQSESGAGAQLGLFVVARLASRHGIQVQLRRSVYAGTTAVVLLPDTLLAVPGETPALPAGGEPGLVPLSSGSPTAPRSAAGPAAGFTPVPAQGGPLPSRRAQAGAEPGETGVIVATTGKPLGRHVRREVIDPEDPDGLPRRVRRRPAVDPAESADTGPTRPEPEGQTTTRSDDARSPEQIRAMMSSFQAGLTRGREAADEGTPGRVDDAPADGAGRPDAGDQASPGTDTDRTAAAPAAADRTDAAGPEQDAGVDGGEQSGAQVPGARGGGRGSRRRRADGGADGEATEAT
jgi:signal transduction histidine kinase